MLYILLLFCLSHSKRTNEISSLTEEPVGDSVRLIGFLGARLDVYLRPVASRDAPLCSAKLMLRSVRTRERASSVFNSIRPSSSNKNASTAAFG